MNIVPNFSFCIVADIVWILRGLHCQSPFKMVSPLSVLSFMLVILVLCLKKAFPTSGFSVNSY